MFNIKRYGDYDGQEMDQLELNLIFDISDSYYDDFIYQYLSDGDEFEYSNPEHQAIVTNWKESAEEDDIEYFKSWYCDLDENSDDLKRVLKNAKIISPQWLIHFTNNAKDISKHGFQKGCYDINSLANTKIDSPYRGGEGPGYNYAYRLNNFNDLTQGYGSEFVIFWSGGIKIFHEGDDEEQIIFWGPDIKSDIYYVKSIKDTEDSNSTRINGFWTVFNAAGNELFKATGDGLFDIYEIKTWLDNGMVEEEKEEDGLSYHWDQEVKAINRCFNLRKANNITEDDLDSRFMTESVNIEDLKEIHRLEYLLSDLSRREYIENNIKLLQLKEKFMSLANKVLNQIKLVFELWDFHHTSDGWIFEHINDFFYNYGEFDNGFFSFSIFEEVKKKILNDLLNKNYNNCLDCNGNNISWIFKEQALRSSEIKIISSDIGKEYLSTFLEETDPENKDSSMQEARDNPWGFILNNQLCNEFIEWLINDNEVELTDFDIKMVDVKYDLTNAMLNNDNYDDNWWWLSFICRLDPEEANDAMSEMLDEAMRNTNGNFEERKIALNRVLDTFNRTYGGKYFDIFINEAKTNGMLQWEESVNDNMINRQITFKEEEIDYQSIESGINRIKESLNRINSALSSDKISDKAIALTLALNTAHVTGGMDDYLGLSKKQLTDMSNLNHLDWDKELQRISNKDFSRCFNLRKARNG